MNSTSGPSSRQGDLLPRSKRPTILLAQDHRLVHLTDTLDWSELEQRAQQVRAGKLKNAAGRPPHLRASLGAMLLMATRKLTYREAEDLIRYYAPARYLCGLTETQWTPDFTTIQDFTQLMGEEGIKLINQYVVQMAVKQKLADPRTAVADTTAQEAAIPYPNEMGLMSGFLTSVASAARKVGRGLKGFVEQTVSQYKAARQKAREYRLFAKTKESKDRVMSQMAAIVEKLNENLEEALGAPAAQQAKLRKYGIVAKSKLVQLRETMSKLLPQIRYWIRTGYVASGKIIMPRDNQFTAKEAAWADTGAVINGKSDIEISNKITDRDWLSTPFAEITAKADQPLPASINQALLCPCDGSLGLSGYVWADNTENFEALPFRGGGWSVTSFAGLAALSLSNRRSVVGGSIGFRPAFIG